MSNSNEILNPSSQEKAIVFSNQELQNWPLECTTYDVPVVFQSCLFKFDLLYTKYTFKKFVSFRNCTFNASLRMILSEFQAPVSFIQCQFFENIYLIESSFDKTVQFSNCQFGPLLAIYSSFKERLVFTQCNTPQTKLLLSRSHFNQGFESMDCNFAEVNFDPKLNKSLDILNEDDNTVTNFVRALGYQQKFLDECNTIGLSVSTANRSWNKDEIEKRLVEKSNAHKMTDGIVQNQDSLLSILKREAEKSQKIIEEILSSSHSALDDLLPESTCKDQNKANEAINSWLEKLRPEYYHFRWSLLADSIACLDYAKFLVPTDPKLIQEAIERCQLYVNYRKWKNNPLEENSVKRLLVLANLAPLCFFSQTYLNKISYLLEKENSATPPFTLSTVLYTFWNDRYYGNFTKNESIQNLFKDFYKAYPKKDDFPKSNDLKYLAEFMPISLISLPVMKEEEVDPSELIRFALGCSLPASLYTALLKWTEDVCFFSNKSKLDKAKNWQAVMRNFIEQGLLTSPCQSMFFLQDLLRNIKVNKNGNLLMQAIPNDKVNETAMFFLTQCYGIVFDGKCHSDIDNTKTITPESAWEQWSQCSKTYIKSCNPLYVQAREPYTMSLGKVSLKNLTTERLILDNLLTFARVEVQGCNINELSAQQSWFCRGTTDACVRVADAEIGTLDFYRSQNFVPLFIQNINAKRDIQIEMASLRQGLRMKDIKNIQGSLLLAGSTFHGTVDIANLNIEKVFDLRDTWHLIDCFSAKQDKQQFLLREVTVKGEFNASGACISEGMEMKGCTFHDKFRMLSASHLQDIYLSPSEEADRYRNSFQEEVVLVSTNVFGRLSFYKALLEKPLQGKNIYSHHFSLNNACMRGDVFFNPAYLGVVQGKKLELSGKLEGFKMVSRLIDLEEACCADTCNLNQAVIARLEMKNATLGTVSMENTEIDEKLVLTNACCQKDILMKQSNIADFDLSGIRIEGNLCLDFTTVTKRAKAVNMTINGKLIAKKASLTNANWSDSTINQAELFKTSFIGQAQFDRCKFLDDGDFSHAMFQASEGKDSAIVSFAKTHWKSQALFQSTQFALPVSFQDSIFESLASFKDTQFPTKQGGQRRTLAYFSSLLHKKEASAYTVDFSKATFSTLADFTRAQFDFLYLSDVTLPSTIVLKWKQLEPQTYSRLALAKKQIYLKPLEVEKKKTNATEEQPCPISECEALESEINLIEEILEKQRDRTNKDRLVMKSRSPWQRLFLRLIHTYTGVFIYLSIMVGLLFCLNFLWFSQIQNLPMESSVEAAWGNSCPVLTFGEMTTKLEIPLLQKDSNLKKKISSRRGIAPFLKRLFSDKMNKPNKVGSNDNIYHSLKRWAIAHQNWLRTTIKILYGLFRVLSMLLIVPFIPVMLLRKIGM
ncbi:MAG: pentapeptide repeat-containing protein [Candidatus Brocadiae bacterium]|nr:pentapeptide repeat-containing protein [Candidatus Brocadiia bacterium]